MGELLGRDDASGQSRPSRSAAASVGQGGGADVGGASASAQMLTASVRDEIARRKTTVADEAARPTATLSPADQAARPADTLGAVDEAAAKEALRYAGGATGLQGGANSLGLFGLTLVTCERGDLRESQHGLFQYVHGVRS